MYKWKLTYTRDYLDEELKLVQEKLLELLTSSGRIDEDDLEALAYEYDWNDSLIDEAMVELAKKMGWNADRFMTKTNDAWDDHYDYSSDELSREMTSEATEYLNAHLMNSKPVTALAASPQSSPI